MKSKLQLVAFMALISFLTQAQETSRVIPFNGVPTTIAPGTLGQTLTIQLWDAAAGGNVFYCENQTLDVDANGNISFNFGAGTTPTPPCASTPPGLKPPDFPTGTSRFLDVVDGTGTSVLPNPPGRIPFTAVAFALSPPNDFPGNVTLMNSSATAGNILKGGVLFLHNFGTANTFLGQGAGNLTMTGYGRNTAVGSSALSHNTSGYLNTAVGADALANNTVGGLNTAVGAQALLRNATGFYNTALGQGALASSIDGYNNTAAGNGALTSNTSGSKNAAFGEGALLSNTSGGNNTALGAEALLNSRGSNNVAVGTAALGNLSAGDFNTALGASALASNVQGFYNVAVGQDALGGVLQGSGNIGVGIDAGAGYRNSESNNIDIGNFGTVGESNTIHIGNSSHSRVFINAVALSPLSGTTVVVNGSGQIGYLSSSRRYKEEIADLGAESDILMKLRPVAFYYKPELDSTRTRQYGLVAEEVAQIAPNLVVFDEKGTPQTVRYHLVNAMLLNEVQKQRRLIEAQQRDNEAQQTRLAAQQQQIDHMNAALEIQKASQQAQMILLREEVKALRDLLQEPGPSSVAHLSHDGH